jgi:hypothetical protein
MNYNEGLDDYYEQQSGIKIPSNRERLHARRWANKNGKQLQVVDHD